MRLHHGCRAPMCRARRGFATSVPETLTAALPTAAAGEAGTASAYSLEDHEDDSRELRDTREGRMVSGPVSSLELPLCDPREPRRTTSCTVGTRSVPPYSQGSASSSMAPRSIGRYWCGQKVYFCAVAAGMRLFSTVNAVATMRGELMTNSRDPVSGNMMKLSFVSKEPLYSRTAGPMAWWISSEIPHPARSTTTVCLTTRPCCSVRCWSSSCI
mmetsp:Transcript_21762/g.64171  ORF Transcript_21762/g.64171 Transcript_21762/m.64171 type:complete len:214 (+) Transcript_21762:304-945(+)